MKNLMNVTLVAVDCTDRINGTIKALLHSSEELEFGDIKILSHEKPENLPHKIKFEQIDKITNINEYNEFMFLELGSYIDTSHCLTIQDHGYIISPSLWNNDWLQYDYIGAIWPIVKGAYLTDSGERVRNGNGGMSLRSKMLMDLPKKMGWELQERQGFFNEDGNCAIYRRDKMIDLGVKYAPAEVAARFAYENPVPENNMGNMATFGFHRNHSQWMKNHE